MNYARLTAALALSVGIPLISVSAQSDSVLAPKIEPPKWSLSIGVDPTDLDLRTRDPGVNARVVGTLTRSWQNPGSRFSRQLSLMVGGDAPRGGLENCYGCWSRVSKQYVGLTGGASVDLFHLGRFTPYTHGGVGLYYTRLSGNPYNGVILSYDPQFNRNYLSVGVNGGFGIKARLGSHEFFIDQTLHAFDAHTLDRGVYPLSIGIRF